MGRQSGKIEVGIVILVDSSVWINYFNGVINTKTDLLDKLLGKQLIVTGDIIMIEVLQGFQSDRDFNVFEKDLKLKVYA